MEGKFSFFWTSRRRYTRAGTKILFTFPPRQPIHLQIVAMVDLSVGPKEGVTYPVEVQYCGNCTMPIEVSFGRFLISGNISIPHVLIPPPSLPVLRVLSRIREMQGLAGEEPTHGVREDQGAGRRVHRSGRQEEAKAGRQGQHKNE